MFKILAQMRKTTGRQKTRYETSTSWNIIRAGIIQIVVNMKIRTACKELWWPVWGDRASAWTSRKSMYKAKGVNPWSNIPGPPFCLWKIRLALSRLSSYTNGQISNVDEETSSCLHCEKYMKTSSSNKRTLTSTKHHTPVPVEWILKCDRYFDYPKSRITSIQLISAFSDKACTNCVRLSYPKMGLNELGNPHIKHTTLS